MILICLLLAFCCRRRRRCFSQRRSADAKRARSSWHLNKQQVAIIAKRLPQRASRPPTKQIRDLAGTGGRRRRRRRLLPERQGYSRTMFVVSVALAASAKYQSILMTRRLRQTWPTELPPPPPPTGAFMMLGAGAQTTKCTNNREHHY